MANNLIQVYKAINNINIFIAIKKHYNECVNNNDFYKMIKRRTTRERADKPKNLATFLKTELHYHYKDFVQYQ